MTRTEMFKELEKRADMIAEVVKSNKGYLVFGHGRLLDEIIDPLMICSIKYIVKVLWEKHKIKVTYYRSGQIDIWA